MPFHATLFEKAHHANWRVAMHSPLALAATSSNTTPMCEVGGIEGPS